MTDRDAALPVETTAAALVRLLGQPPLDAETAARIAAGAARAAAALRATVTVPLIDVEPGGFLAELERLAGPEP
jgi:hypothetical protein